MVIVKKFWNWLVDRRLKRIHEQHAREGVRVPEAELMNDFGVSLKSIIRKELMR